MIRIVDGIVYECTRDAESLELVVRQLGEHREAVVQRPMVMRELDAPETVLQWWREREAKGKSAAELAESKEAARQRVARRRKTEGRRRVKAMGHNTLLTGTYRALQGDLSQAWRHWKEFVRRVRRVLPGFSYVVAWERQKRGAWHWHASTHNIPRTLPASNGVKVKSFNVLRAIWRSVVGDLGGNVDVAKRQRSARVTQARIASYLSKYMLKSSLTVADGENVWASSAITLPPPERVRFHAADLLDCIALAHCCVGGEGLTLASAWVAPWGDTVYLAAEPG